MGSSYTNRKAGKLVYIMTLWKKSHYNFSLIITITIEEIFSILSTRNELAPLFPLMLHLLSLVPWMREHELRTENNIAIGQTILRARPNIWLAPDRNNSDDKMSPAKTAAQISCRVSMSDSCKQHFRNCFRSTPRPTNQAGRRGRWRTPRSWSTSKAAATPPRSTVIFTRSVIRTSPWRDSPSPVTTQLWTRGSSSQITTGLE